jgi:hypothetical protein
MLDFADRNPRGLEVDRTFDRFPSEEDGILVALRP